MTAPDPDVDAFFAALPAEFETVRPTNALRYNIRVALREKGWTVAQLVHEAQRDHNTGRNPAAIIHDRMKIAATINPPGTQTAKRKGIPFCSDECRQNAGWVLNADGLPDHRCPCRSAA